MLRDHAWRLGCDRDGRVTAVAVRSGRTRFVSWALAGRRWHGDRRSPTPYSATPQAELRLPVRLSLWRWDPRHAPRISIPDWRKRGQGPCERGREDDIDQLHSFDIDWSNFPVSTLFGHSPCRLKIRTPAPPRLVHLAGTRCVFIAPIACGMNVPRSPHAPLGYTL